MYALFLLLLLLIENINYFKLRSLGDNRFEGVPPSFSMMVDLEILYVNEENRREMKKRNRREIDEREREKREG